MKKTLLLFVMFVLLVSGRAYAENLKVGVVDLLKALNESDTGKKAKTDLESLIKSKQVVIDEKGKEIEKLRTELEKQTLALAPEAKKSKEEDLERKMREYQRVVSDSQNDVKKKENEYTGEIIKEIRAIVEKIGQEQGYTMIIENAEGVLLYSKKELDLTSIVIKRYNESKAKK
jgi:outer membrane protein